MAQNNTTRLLVEKAKQGDRAALEALFESHRPRLLSRIDWRLSDQLKRRVDPEDILHGALCTAFETIDRFHWQGEDSFFAWISAIAEHLILNATKKKQLKTLRLDRDIPRSSVTGGKAMSREERFERLKASLAALTPDQREAVMLARIDGLPTKEIARRMGRSEDAVRQLLTRALRQLKTSFGETESLNLPERSLREEGLADG